MQVGKTRLGTELSFGSDLWGRVSNLLFPTKSPRGPAACKASCIERLPRDADCHDEQRAREGVKPSRARASGTLTPFQP